MNQSNKEYIELLIQSGVHTFLKETPNNLLSSKDKENKPIKKIIKKNLYEINEIEELISLISTYESPLKKTVKNLLVNNGNIQSKIMIIAESPSKDDDEQGELLVGKEGQLLDKMLSAIKKNRKDICITNVIPWRLPEDRPPTDAEILEFLPFLQRQIEIIQPSLIYLLGTTPAKAILSTPLNIEKLRGRWHNYKSLNMNIPINVLVSYDPGFLLNFPIYKKKAWVDLQMLERKINEN